MHVRAFERYMLLKQLSQLQKFYDLFLDLRGKKGLIFLFCLVCCFTSQSTAMVMSRRSAHLTTLFPEQALLSS